MKQSQARLAQSLRAVQGFIANHADRLPGVARSGARRKLDELVQTFSDDADSQAASDLAAQMATREHHALRTALLRDHMQPIVKIAALEASALPALSVLRMPPRWASPERLHAYALGMADSAAQSAHVFTAAGLPANFAEQLTDAADATLAAVGARTSRRQARARATAGVRVTISAARRAVGALDALVTSALHTDAALLVAWKSAIHPERGRRRAAAAIAATAAVSPGVALAAIAESSAFIESTEFQPEQLPAAEHRIRQLSDRWRGAFVEVLSRTRIRRRLVQIAGEHQLERDLVGRGGEAEADAAFDVGGGVMIERRPDLLHLPAAGDELP